MVQHRLGLSIVSGGLILVNFFNLASIFLLFFFSSSNEFFSQPIQISLSIINQTFSFLLGSVFWKIRLNDRRPDLLVAIQSSLSPILFLQSILLITYGISKRSSIIYPETYFMILLPSLIFIFYLISKFQVLKICESRLGMITASFLLSCIGITLLVLEFALTFICHLDLKGTKPLSSLLYNSNQLNSTTTQFLLLKPVHYSQVDRDQIDVEDMSLFAEVFIKFGIPMLAVFIPVGKVIYLWLSYRVNVSHPLIFINEEDMYNLYYWLLLSAFVALTGSATSIPFLSSAIFIGSSIPPSTLNSLSLNKEELDLFFSTVSSQKPDFTY